MIALRDRGLAELENEKPELAEPLFRELAEQLPDDPLPSTNLAISLLRQQRLEEAAAALLPVSQESASARRVLIGAVIAQQSGDMQLALQQLDQALTLDVSDSEIAFAAFNLASQMRGEQAAALAKRALEALLVLRRDNPWVALKGLQQALANDQRADAAGHYLRLNELAWRFEEDARGILRALEEDINRADLKLALGDALRLENLLRASDLYRESLRDLRVGILGLPIERFANEPDYPQLTTPLALEFKASPLATTSGRSLALAAADLDNDGLVDLLQLVEAIDAQPPQLQWYLGKQAHALGGSLTLPEPFTAAAPKLLIVDLDNDEALDVLISGSGGMFAYAGDANGGFALVSGAWGLASVNASALAPLDFDIEGDLDLAVVGPSGGLGLYRNNLGGELESVGASVFDAVSARHAGPRQLLASDLDRDGDVDLLLLHAGGLSWLDNRRYGEFADRGEATTTDLNGQAAATADMDNDGTIDLLLAGPTHLVIARNHDAQFAQADRVSLAHQVGRVDQLIVADFDNDTRKDVLLRGDRGLELHLQGADQQYLRVELDALPTTAVVVADMDADGRLDIVVGSGTALSLLSNQSAAKHGWLSVRAKGLTSGNSKNNSFGVGAILEVRNGDAYQLVEISSDHTHIGLGGADSAEVLRLLWTNGVPQNRFDVTRNQSVVEEQVLKGSCPFLYAWNGERFEFVTDLLWGAPLGLPVAPGVWLPADPSELVRVDGLVADQGVYPIRITEELWEAAFFDQLKLWVVDHPVDVEVASNLRIIPGQTLGQQVLASRQLQPLTLAIDGHGKQVTELVAQRDERYAAGYTPSRYQGVAADPWSFTMDLGRAPNGPVRLHLEGWIFPADASLNLAVAQRPDLPYLPPRIEVETAQGWEVLLDNAGFPAGKTKAMVIDLPALPRGSQRLRMVSNLWLHWDRIRWTEHADDDAFIIRAKLPPAQAQLVERGYSRLLRRAPNAPHSYDYTTVSSQSPWQVFPGNYTRLGEVAPLLLSADDFSVILAAGDELQLQFDARDLPPPEPGMRRTLFLESHGWDKDADLNTFQAQQVEPLPFRAMSGYPGKPGEHYPDTAEHRQYRSQWLTRELR